MKKVNLIAQAILLTSTLGVSAIAVANTGGYQDPILTLQGTPDVIKKGMDVDGYSSAVSAWNWGIPHRSYGAGCPRVHRCAFTEAGNQLSRPTEPDWLGD